MRPGPTPPIGTRFGRLVISGPMTHDANGVRACHCRCDCGTETIVRLWSLLTNATQSCGCYQRDYRRHEAVKHCHARVGARTPEYRAWQAIKDRCLNPRCDCFPNYGGRGITICAEWIASFQCFLSEVGPRPSALHSIDRIDNSRGYQPGNVKWSTRREQNNNSRWNKRLTHNGVTHTMAEWARVLNVSYRVLRQRVDRGQFGTHESASVTSK